MGRVSKHVAHPRLPHQPALTVVLTTHLDSPHPPTTHPPILGYSNLPGPTPAPSHLQASPEQYTWTSPELYTCTLT